MKRTDPQSLAEIIEAAFRQADASETIRAHRVSALWPVVVGQGINRHTTRRWVEGTTLHVMLDSAPLKQELAFSAPKLIEEINKTLGHPFLTDLRFH